MKIVIVEGRHEADYVISMFKSSKNKLIVINSDEEVCKYLSKKNMIDVLFGRPTKEYDLRCAEIENADVFISLCPNDVEAYVSCKMAKMIFNVKRVVATVINPKNVDLFHKLGISSVICSTHLLAQSIKNESSLEDLLKTISLEDDKICITEVKIQQEYDICDKTLKDIQLPDFVSVSCVYRYPHVIIPNGNTKLLVNDKVLLVSTKDNQETVINLVQKRKEKKNV